MAKEDHTIETKLKSLSADEKEYLTSLRSQDGEVFTLHNVIFRMLAGRPLATFASELVSAQFIHALYNVQTRGSNTYREICRFNTCDWSEMRAALRKAIKWLSHPDTSRVGKSTQAEVLNATGNQVDAKTAVKIELLNFGQSTLQESWSHANSVSETHICNPNSPEPENLPQVIDRLGDFLPTKYATDRRRSSGSMILDHALLPLVRHRPKLITAALRSFIDDVVNRSSTALEYGLFQLESHRALVTPDQATRFVGIWLDSQQTDRFDKIDDKQRSKLLQFCLLASFHNFDGNRHLEILTSGPSNVTFLSSLLSHCEPASKSILHKIVGETDWTSNSTPRVRAILTFLTATKPTLTKAQIGDIGRIFDGYDASIVLPTLILASELNEMSILQRFTESRWASLRKVEGYSAWPYWA